MKNDYPLSESQASRMLAQGLARAKEERGWSIRQIGKLMGYKTSVVLSHMASGRVPIPIDRAEELADIIGLDKKDFLQSVLIQRHPRVSWGLLSGPYQTIRNDNLTLELEAALGSSLKDLSLEQRAVMREVAAEKSPRRRWLTVHELHAVEKLRKLFPSIRNEGISSADWSGVEALLTAE